MKHDWQEWIDRVGNKDVSEQDLCDFQKALGESPDHVDDYLQALLTETALEMKGGLPASVSSATAQASSVISFESAKDHGAPSQGKNYWGVTAIAATVALLLGLSYFMGRQHSPTDAVAGTVGEGVVDHVATITDADKIADAVGLRIGKPLHTGEIKVPEGSEIGIAMRGGARLEINGPASFRIDGPDRVFLHKGRIRTYAPEYAHGFAIDTDEGKIIDLGTRFVTANGTDAGTEIHVIEGLVQAKGFDSSMFYIAGEEAAILKDGKMLDTDYLAQRLRIPLDPNLTDTDGDTYADLIETHYGTKIDDASSFPEPLRIADGFQDYGKTQINGAGYQGKGRVANSSWSGGGQFLEQGLQYQNDGLRLKTSGGCLQTTGEHGVGSMITPDSQELSSDGMIYISFLMQQPKKQLDRAFSGLILYQGEYKEQFFLGELSVADSYGSRYAESSEEDPFAVAADDQTHLFVIRIDRTRFLTDVFIDPPLSKVGKDLLPQKRYQDAPQFDRIVLRSGSDAGIFPVKFDEIRVGLSWESVLPVQP